jgi:hypothetical protein
MRWWTGAWMVAGIVILAGCGASPGGGSAGRPSGSTSAGPSAGAPTHASGVPSPSAPANPTASATEKGPSRGTSGPAATPAASETSCAAGHVTVTVAPGDAVERRLCVRPGTVVSLVLQARSDGKRWSAVHSSTPVFVLASGWKADADGTAHASLRCANTRGGTARVTALAKTPDIAGAARGAFILEVSVVPYPKEG